MTILHRASGPTGQSHPSGPKLGHRRRRRLPAEPAVVPDPHDWRKIDVTNPAARGKKTARDEEASQTAASPNGHIDAERQRLVDAQDGSAAWYRWGPYLADRQWGSVREDYSAYGAPGIPFRTITRDPAPTAGAKTDCSASRDDQNRLCFALALWNGADPILKERLFGLTGSEGNHGEDVKEHYYLPRFGTPTHSYMKALYKYPQRAFPYGDLVAENRRRVRDSTPSTS